MEHYFTKGFADYAPGVLWLVRSRIEQHEHQYGGRKPHHLILHTGTLRSLFADYLREIGDTGDDMPPVENVTFAAFEGVSLYHCRCGQPLAPDMLCTVDGKHEDL